MPTQPRPLLSRLHLLSVAISLSSTMLWAQTPTGSISGTVHDPTGAVVPNAFISMNNPETGLLRSLLTAPDGSYTAAALPPGVYQVKAAMKGFRTMIREA